MIETFNSSDLISNLRERLFEGKVGVIGIDGIDGSGKTTLANEIGTALKLPVLSIDDFLNKQKGSYLEHLKYSDLSSAINSSSAPIIIEGVCLLHVAEDVGLNVTDLIYIKQVNDWNFWIDEETCDPKKPVEELIERLGEDADEISTSIEGLVPSTADTGSKGLTPFRKQIIRYHARFRPARKADYIFLKRSS